MDARALFSEGFLIEKEREVVLNNVLTLIFPTDVVEELQTHSLSKNEVGGLLLFKVKKCEDKSRVLNAFKVIQIPNSTPSPDIYSPNLEKVQEIVDEYSKKDLCIPMTFHTHALPNRGEYLEMYEYYYQTEPSTEDKKYIDKYKTVLYNKIFYLPDIIVVSETFRNRLLLGYYGIGTENGMRRQFWVIKVNCAKTIVDGIKFIKKEHWNKMEPEMKLFIGGLLAALFMANCYFYFTDPRFRKFIDNAICTVFQLGMLEMTGHMVSKEMSMVLEEGRYFKQATPNGEIKIFIPDDNNMENCELFKMLEDLGD